jgi:hypothetical protein
MPQKFNSEDLKRAIGALGLLRFSPLADPETRAAAMEEIAAMCPHLGALQWLPGRVNQLFPEWPGMQAIRAVLCSKYKPADGVDVGCPSFPDGIPSERLEEPERLALPPGHQASADRELDGIIANLAARKMLPAATPDPDKCQRCGCTRGKGLIVEEDSVVACPDCLAYTANQGDGREGGTG